MLYKQYTRLSQWIIGLIALFGSSLIWAQDIVFTANWPVNPQHNTIFVQKWNPTTSGWDYAGFFTGSSGNNNPTFTISSASDGRYRVLVGNTVGYTWGGGYATLEVVDGATVKHTANIPEPPATTAPNTSALVHTFFVWSPLPAVDCGQSSSSTGSGFATTGTGLYKPYIYWLDWSCNGSNSYVYQLGGTYTKSWVVSPNITLYGTLKVTGQNNVKPYNISTLGSNQLVDLYGGNNFIALSNEITITDQTPDPVIELAYDLQIAGQSVQANMVTAPAESIDGDNESQKITTNGDDWELLEIPTVTNLQAQYSNGNKTIELTDPSNLAESVTILLTENATNITAELNAGGKDAFAFGLFLGLDFSDAPASYGVPSHYNILSAQGSSKPTTATDVTTLTASTIVYDPVRLGTINTDAEVAAFPGADADGDDLDTSDDEDGVTAINTVTSADTSYSLTVSCQGGQKVIGWIDWDIDGGFSQAKDKSAETTCSGTSATLNWSGLTGIKDGVSYLRVRTSSATGFAAADDAVISGEVEDYKFTISPSADLSVTKTSGNANFVPGGVDTYTIVVTNNGPSDVTGVTITDTLPAGATLSGAWSCAPASSCTPASAGSAGQSSVLLTADINNGETVTITVPVIYSMDPTAY